MGIKGHYVVYLVVVIAIIVLVVLMGLPGPNETQLSIDFRVNMIAEIMGFVLTVVFLSFIIEYVGGKLKWAKVEREAEKDLKGLLDRLFIDLSKLIRKFNSEADVEVNINSPRPFMEEDIAVLKTLYSHKSVYFRDNEPETHMGVVDYPKIFLDAREQLSSMEFKYFKFWPADLIKELMIIQRNLFTLSWVFKTIEQGHGNKRFAEYRIKDIMDSLYQIYTKHKLDFPDTELYDDSGKYDEDEVMRFVVGLPDSEPTQPS